MKRVLCVWLPNFPIQRRQCEPSEPDSLQPVRCSRSAVVLYHESGNRAQVVQASQTAAASGIRSGMSLAEAQALLDSADFLPHDPAADDRELRSLSYLCHRFSPTVGLLQFQQDHGLVLDISGCEHLFGGELPLAGGLLADLAERGYFGHAAVAATQAAAWAIARYGHQAGADRRLRSLPVAALRIPDKLVSLLQEFELRQIGQLLALPRDTLPARFGTVLAERLDQIFGRREELLSPVPRPEPVAAEWVTEDPVRHQSAVLTVCDWLLSDVLRDVTARAEGILRLQLQVQPETGRAVTQEIRLTRPAESRTHILQLLQLKLETWSLPDRIVKIRLEASGTAPVQVHQRSLFGDDEADDDGQVRRLLDRLAARLGLSAVVRPELLPEAVPEQAVRYVPVQDKTAAQQRTSSAATDAGRDPSLAIATARPLQLLAQPQPIHVTATVLHGPPVRFGWQGQQYRIAYSTQPERIATAWWQDSGPVQRDYYQVETIGGARFWIFRDDRHQWFLHGIFD